MKNTNKTAGKTATESVGVTETQDKLVRAKEVRKTKTGFKVLYENGQTMWFDLGYMDRTGIDFPEVTQ